MTINHFKSIISKFPFVMWAGDNFSQEYQYTNTDLCRYLIIKFSVNPNFISVPYSFGYNKKSGIFTLDKNGKQCFSFLFYKQIKFPTEEQVITELSRMVKQIKNIQYKIKLDSIKQDF